jgi:hypothetical protein
VTSAEVWRSSQRPRRTADDDHRFVPGASGPKPTTLLCHTSGRPDALSNRLPSTNEETDMNADMNERTADPTGPISMPGTRWEPLADRDATDESRRSPFFSGEHVGCMVDGCGRIPSMMWVDLESPWLAVLCEDHASQELADVWVIANPVFFDGCSVGLRRAAETRAAWLWRRHLDGDDEDDDRIPELP